LDNHYDVAIVGGGFTGLTAAYALSKVGLKVRVIESDNTAGGLAGTFQFSDGIWLEKFYHHWFNNDVYVPELVKELGMEGDIITLPTKTGMYFNGRTWNLSKPLDLLKFKPLNFFERIRLGLLVFRVRRIVDWRFIENLSIREWLEPLCGKKVFKVVWEPLLTSKFSIYAEQVNAVWMWKKLMLRGGTRNNKGGEELAYFKGGFGRLADAMVSEIERLGGCVATKEKVTGVHVDGNKVMSITTDQGVVNASQYLFTPALPIIANIFNNLADGKWLEQLRRVRYLGNMCLVLRLNKSLSETYWLNVNDPGFPFVGVIEHTNFDSSENYGNSHIVYLSRYLSTDDPIWAYSDDDYLDYSFIHLKRMFPDLDRSWLIDSKVWRAEYAQPVTERNYSKYVPEVTTPFDNVFISTMAQIYPEDRGTNYAIRDGKLIAKRLAQKFN
jgi:protoporphyrinogen oxidase